METYSHLQIKPSIWIGIDTGTNTGIAVYDPNFKILTQLKTVPIYRAMDMVRNYHESYGAKLFVRFEDARLRKWLSKDVGMERLQGAGSIKRDAAIWEEFLKDMDVRYEAVAPKNNRTKMTASVFTRLTGWDKICSNHARDAAMLVWGY